MKKTILTTLFLVCATLSARADIGINWLASLGFYNNGTGPAPSDPDDYIGFVFGSWTAQLIWSEDGVVSEIDPFNAGAGYVSGDEIVLRTLTGTGDYGDYSAPAPSVYEDSTYTKTLDSGFVYARIFGGTAPIIGEYYNASPVLAADLYSESAPALQQLDHNQGDDGIIGGELDRLIVPEPSTLAFLSLGGLALAWRRRFAV